MLLLLRLRLRLLLRLRLHCGVQYRERLHVERLRRRKAPLYPVMAEGAHSPVCTVAVLKEEFAFGLAAHNGRTAVVRKLALDTLVALSDLEEAARWPWQVRRRRHAGRRAALRSNNKQQPTTDGRRTH